MKLKSTLLIQLFALSLVWHCEQVLADTLDNANALFDYAEFNFPELLNPPSPETQEVQGFYVRYYSGTDIYLGVQGDNVWALGAQLGPEVVYVGKLEDFESLNLSPTDISDAILTNQRASCTYYADSLFSRVRDIQNNTQMEGSLDISVDAQSNECVFTTNSVPNHDYNGSGAAFVTPVAAIDNELRIPIEPTFAGAVTELSLTYDNAILLNGVKVDLLAAACYNVGDEKIGCNDIATPWRFDPMSSLNQFGTDSHNAHTQPDGAYHYHGNPEALFDQGGNIASPVIGFAADGFPIYGSYIEDNGQVRAVTSSYRLRDGARPGGSDNPVGDYDGTYIDDYEYVQGLGDLDECNGMMRNGSYGYYVINSYPWVLACYQGTPHASFAKTAGGNDDSSGGQGGGPGGGGGGSMSPPGGS